MKLQFKSLFGALAGAVCLLTGTQVSEAVVIYPQPQINGMRSVTTRVTEAQTIYRTPESKGGMWDRLPDVPGGYAIEITPGKLTIYAVLQGIIKLNDLQ